MDLVRACDGLSPLPVEEKALTGPAPMRGHAVYRLWAITRGAKCFCRLRARYPEVNANCVYYKFPGRRTIQ